LPQFGSPVVQILTGVGIYSLIVATMISESGNAVTDQAAASDSLWTRGTHFYRSGNWSFIDTSHAKRCVSNLTLCPNVD